MLDGVVPFPPEYAARYRAKGYWQDKSLATNSRSSSRSSPTASRSSTATGGISYADIDRAERQSRAQPR